MQQGNVYAVCFNTFQNNCVMFFKTPAECSRNLRQILSRWPSKLSQWCSVHILGAVHLAKEANLYRHFHCSGCQLCSYGGNAVQHLGSGAYNSRSVDDHSRDVWLYGFGWDQPQCCTGGYTHSFGWSGCRIYCSHVLGKSYKIIRLRFDFFQWTLTSKIAQRSFSLKGKTFHSILNKQHNRKVLLISEISLDSMFAMCCGDKIPLQRQRFYTKRFILSLRHVASTCCSDMSPSAASFPVVTCQACQENSCNRARFQASSAQCAQARGRGCAQCPPI